MIGPTELRRSLAAALVVVSLPACGSDKTTLVIKNEQGSRGEITQVLVRDCLGRYWSPLDPPLSSVADTPPGGPVRIGSGEAVELEILPGCHDVVATRDTDEVARARVILEPGTSVTWVPFLIDEQETFWCYSDCE